MRFDGRVALITAAASGIGRATAEIISAEGGTVVAVDTDEGRLKDMIGALQAAGGRAHAHRADALDATQVDNVVERRRVNTATSISSSTRWRKHHHSPARRHRGELTLPEWQQLLAFNLDGTFLSAVRWCR